MMNFNVINKSVSNESLGEISKKIASKTLFAKSKSETNIKIVGKHRDYATVVYNFFNEYPKNLINNSINWLKVIYFQLT